MNPNLLIHIEKILEEHPGVRRAAVSAWKPESGEKKFFGYILPDNEYLDRDLRDEGEEEKRLKQWRTVYNWFEKGKSASPENTGFDTSIWNSTYTRKAIPREQMLEWAEWTAKEILSLNPAEVLEIGCGTGPLLLRIAPRTRRYVGIDFSASSLKSVPRQMEKLGRSWDMVKLLERPADNLEDFREDSFDTVVMNSVIQCFPSFDYLKKVLDQMMKVTKPGGSIFIGDVRNFALLSAFAVSVELYQAPSTMSLCELRQRVRKRLLQERELVVSPAFFLALRQYYPKISNVTIRPKRGQFDNELNSFRYDVILHLGPAETSVTKSTWLDWPTQNLTAEDIRERLQDKKTKILAIGDVANSRVEKDIAALAYLLECSVPSTVGEVRTELSHSSPRGLHPHTLSTLGEEDGYQVDLSWARNRSDGSYDVIFRKKDAGNGSNQPRVAWPEPDRLSSDLTEYLSDPVRIAHRLKLVQQLHEYVKEKLHENERPVDFLLLETLPLTTSGTIDREALQSLDIL